MGTDRRWFVALLLTFGYFYQGGFANSNARFDLALAIALEHRYPIDDFAANTIDKVHARGHIYSEKAPGTAFAALPVAVAASAVLDPATLRRRPALADLLLHIATALSVGAVSALAAVAFRRLLSLLNPALDRPHAWLLTAAVYLGTPLFVYSTVLFGHALAAGWLVIALYLGVRAARMRSGGGLHASAAAIAGGLAVLTEYPAVIPAAAAALAVLLVARRPKTLLWALPAALVPVGLLLLHQNASFGSPFAIGYGHLGGTPFATEMSRGLFGITAPSPTAAVQLLFGVYRGLFVYAPILAAAVAGFALWPRLLRRRLAAPLLAGACGLWLVIAGYAFWQGGPAFGPRHLVPVIPFIGLGLAFWPRGRWWRWALGALAAVSIAINVAGTATTPYVSEFIPDPIISVYPRLVRDGAVSLNPVAFLTPASEVDERWADPDRYAAVSYNLGERLGLGGWASLLPLAAMWLLLLGWPARGIASRDL